MTRRAPAFEEIAAMLDAIDKPPLVARHASMDAFLARPLVVAMVEKANRTTKPINYLCIFNLYHDFILASEGFSALEQQRALLSQERVQHYNAHLKRNRTDLNRIQQAIVEEQAKLKKAETKLASIKSEKRSPGSENINPLQARQQRVVDTYHKVLAELEKERASLSFRTACREGAFGFDEEKLLSLTQQLDEVRNFLALLHKHVAREVDSPTKHRRRQDDGDDDTPGSNHNASSNELEEYVNSQCGSPVAAPFATFARQGSGSFREGSLAGQCSGALSSSMHSSARTYALVRLAFLRKHKPEYFTTTYDFTNPQVFNQALPLGDYVDLETIADLLWLKTKNTVLFQETCALLSCVYKRLTKSGRVSRAFFAEDKSDSDDDGESAEEMNTRRNTIVVKCVKELLGVEKKRAEDEKQRLKLMTDRERRAELAEHL